MPSAYSVAVLRAVLIGLLLAILLAPGWTATLEHLSLDDMIAKSTAIIQGRVTGSSATLRGSVIYTDFKVTVLKQYKGSPVSSTDVLVPGGTLRGVRQTYPGAPQLVPGQDYVLFLWTSRSGATYTLGFTQGVFTLAKDSSGVPTAVRAPTSETILEPGTGIPVKDQPIRMPLAKLASYIASHLGGASQ